MGRESDYLPFLWLSDVNSACPESFALESFLKALHERLETKDHG
jgi:hypothetical protein